MFIMYLKTEARYNCGSDEITEEKIIYFLRDYMDADGKNFESDYANEQCLTDSIDCPDLNINVSSNTCISSNSLETYYRLEITTERRNDFDYHDDTYNMIEHYIKNMRDALYYKFYALDQDRCTCMYIKTNYIF